MVEQLVLSHRLDMNDPVNFLLLMGSAVDQGTLDASGDVPRVESHPFGDLELTGGALTENVTR